MTLEEAWTQLHKPFNRFDQDLMALRIIIEELKEKAKDLERKLQELEDKAEDQERRLKNLEEESMARRIPMPPESLNVPVKKRGRPRKEAVHAKSDGTSPETASS